MQTASLQLQLSNEVLESNREWCVSQSCSFGGNAGRLSDQKLDRGGKEIDVEGDYRDLDGCTEFKVLPK